MSGGLSNVEKLSYGLGNLGINLIFGMTGAYLLYFYTDVYHVTATFVAAVFLLARGIDAVFDPLLGLLIDRTHTRFGKHRPYLIAVALPFAVCAVAVFATPPLTGAGKMAYILISYTLLGMLYSGLSLPLNSMLPTLTRDPAARTATNALREFMGSSATVGVGFITWPLVHALGGSSPARGFLGASTIFALIALVSLVTVFLNTRERVQPTTSPTVLTTRQSLLSTRGNWPWISTMIVNFFFWVGFISHSQSVVYYATDVVGRPNLVSTLMLTMLPVLVGTGASAFVANRLGKKLTGMIGAGVAAAALAALPISPSIAWLIAMNVVSYLGLGLVGGLLFALMADAVDYGEWKSGFRAQGFLYAASSFGVKLGMSIGGAAGAWLLAQGGYVAGAAATPAIIASIDWGYIWIPVASFLGMAGGLLLFTFHPDYSRGRLASPEQRPAPGVAPPRFDGVVRP